jgi:16S rRNA (guanine966-N2)-methyltransferase
LRIIAGKNRGQRLIAPAGRSTRPTSDRIRESIFNILTHNPSQPSVEGRRVLDLFAGSGALGFEALSRGARFCQFVDTDAEARAVIRRNADALGVTGMCKIWRRDSTQLGRCVPQAPFDLVFVDPPYNKDLGSAALASLVDGQWLGPHAMIVLEESAQSIPVVPPQLQLVDAREYGDTKVIFYTADRDWNGGRTIPSNGTHNR